MYSTCDHIYSSLVLHFLCENAVFIVQIFYVCGFQLLYCFKNSLSFIERVVDFILLPVLVLSLCV